MRRIRWENDRILKLGAKWSRWSRILSLLAISLSAVLFASISYAAQNKCASIISGPTSAAESAIWTSLDQRLRQSFLTSQGVARQDRNFLSAWANSPFHSDLKKKFGFKFETDENIYPPKVREDQTLFIPPVESMFHRYMTLVERAVSLGIVRSDETIEPVFVFKLKTGEERAYRFGERVPEGAHLSDGVMTNKEFLKLVANGMMPIGGEKLTPTDIPTFQHDMAHLAGFMANPRYMAAVREYAKENLKAATVKSDPSRTPRARATSLGYVFIEGLIFVRPARRAQLLERLHLPKEFQKNPSTAEVDGLANQLKNKSAEELRATWLDLRSVIDSEALIQVLGGAGREPRSSLANPLHHPLKSIRPIDIEYEPEDAARAIARLQLAVIRLSRISMEDWTETLRTGKPTNAIRQFYLEPSIWDADTLAIFESVFDR